MDDSDKGNASGESTPRPWLRDQVYEPRRQRTVDLVHRSIEELKRTRRGVSINSIIVMSKKLDPEGRGISRNALLTNKEARSYYEQQRSWTTDQKPGHQSTIPESSKPTRIGDARDKDRLRQRYQRLSKSELISQLLELRDLYAQLKQQLLELSKTHIELTRKELRSKR